jgi:hypothetical protein
MGIEAHMEIWFHKAQIHSFFHATTILTNYLHRCHMDFTYEVIGNQIQDPINYGWDGDF